MRRRNKTERKGEKRKGIHNGQSSKKSLEKKHETQSSRSTTTTKQQRELRKTCPFLLLERTIALIPFSDQAPS
jgi:hypothetical protein